MEEVGSKGCLLLLLLLLTLAVEPHEHRQAHPHPPPLNQEGRNMKERQADRQGGREEGRMRRWRASGLVKVCLLVI